VWIGFIEAFSEAVEAGEETPWIEASFTFSQFHQPILLFTLFSKAKLEPMSRKLVLTFAHKKVIADRLWGL